MTSWKEGRKEKKTSYTFPASLERELTSLAACGAPVLKPKKEEEPAKTEEGAAEGAEAKTEEAAKEGEEPAKEGEEASKEESTEGESTKMD